MFSACSLPAIRATLIAAALLCAGLGFATPAAADPCEGALPRAEGARFAGTVRYVGDGDSFCVGASDDPATWIEVRMLDFNAIELTDRGGRVAQAIAERVLMGREIVCIVGRGRNGRTGSWDRAHARCTIEGRGVGAILRDAGVEEGGR